MAESDSSRIGSLSNVRSFSMAIVALTVGTLALKYANEIFIPIAISIIISYALDPVVSMFARWNVPRSVTAAVLLLGIVGGVGWTVYTLRDDAATVLERIPAAARKFRQALRENDGKGPGAIEKIKKAAGELEKTAAEATKSENPLPANTARVQVVEESIKLSDYLWIGSMGMMTATGQVLMILFLVYFILSSGDLYKRKLVKIVGPSMSQKRLSIEILDEINAKVQRFLLVQIFTGVVVAVASWLAFHWLGLEQAAVWGIAAGLFNSIPYFGPVLVAAGVAIVGFLQFGTLYGVAMLVGVALLITSLEGYLLTPWLMGRAAQMNAVAVFVGLLFWGWVWGAWGMFLAVPILVGVKVVCDHLEEFKAIGELLGE